MYLDAEKIKRLAVQKNSGLKEILKKAGVSATAYYSLIRKESILPKSILTLARALDVKPQTIISFENHEVLRAKKRLRQCEEILRKHPQADRENVMHTLILLDERPLNRLKRGLRRGQNQGNFYKRRG